MQEIGEVTGCIAGSNGISDDIAADEVNYVVSTTTPDGVITLATEGVDEDGNSLDLELTPTPQGAALRWDFDTAQTGCRTTTPGRGINCDP